MVGAKGRSLPVLDRSEKQISRYSLCQIRWQQQDRQTPADTSQPFAPRRTRVLNTKPTEAAVSSNTPLLPPHEAAQLGVLHTDRRKQLD